MSAPKWSNDEAKKLRDLAKQVLRKHNHLLDCVDADTLDNCGACAISGRNELTEGGPNYSGWARVYVEAGVAIPRKWKEAFERECFSSNHQYTQALRQSIATFGFPKFT